MLSVAVTTGIGGYTAVTGGRLAVLGEALAYAGALVIAIAVVGRFASVIPWGIALAGGGYVAGRVGHGTADGWAAGIGAALLLAAELAAWSAAHDRRFTEERPLLVHRLALLGGLLACAALAGFVLMGAAALSASAGILLSAVGMAAAITAVGVILRLLRG